MVEPLFDWTIGLTWFLRRRSSLHPRFLRPPAEFWNLFPFLLHRESWSDFSWCSRKYRKPIWSSVSWNSSEASSHQNFTSWPQEALLVDICDSAMCFFLFAYFVFVLCASLYVPIFCAYFVFFFLWAHFVFFFVCRLILCLVASKTSFEWILIDDQLSVFGTWKEDAKPMDRLHQVAF